MQQSLSLSQRIGDIVNEGATLNNIGTYYYEQGDYKRSLKYWERSLKISRQTDNVQTTALIMINVATAYFSDLQDVEKAIPLFLQAYLLLKQIGAPNVQIAESYLNAIIEQIGEERFNQIIQNNPQP